MRDSFKRFTKRGQCVGAFPRCIANAEVAKLNAEQAETIERLRDGLREIHEAALKTWNYSAAAPFPDCPYYLGLIRGTAARCLSDERGAAEPKPLPTESAKGSETPE